MKPTASARVPERARLAATIERHAEAAEQLARVERAIQRIQDDRINDRTAIARAHEALKIATAGRSEILIASALGEPVPDLPSPAAAKTTLDECEAKLDADRSALRMLETEAQRARSTLALREMTLAQAVKDAVTADPALAALRDEFERCRLHMSRLIGALLGSGHEVSRVGWHETAFLPDPAWTTALAALRTDPDAKLPSPPPDGPDHAHGSNDKRAAA